MDEMYYLITINNEGTFDISEFNHDEILREIQLNAPDENYLDEFPSRQLDPHDLGISNVIIIKGEIVTPTCVTNYYIK